MIGIDIQCKPDEEFIELSFDRLVSEFEWRILNDISADRRWLLTLIFSAKETFYKAVFPIIRKVLDFREAQLISVDLDRNSLLIQACEMVDNPNLGFLRLEIKYKEIRQGTFLTYTVSNFNQRSGVIC